MPHRDRLSLPSPRFSMSALAATVLAGALLIATPPPDAAAAPNCTRYAAASGTDSNPGTADRPFRTAQRLLDSLSPGETGCLQPGATFEGKLRANHGGAPGRPITLTTGPGPGRATVLGWLYVPDGVNDIIFRNLTLNGRDSGSRVSPSVNGDRIQFLNNDITNDYYGICLHLGKAGGGAAEDIVVDGNRIYRCGILPAAGHDHGIYVNTSRNVRITNNYIYDNADYGIQLYPDAQSTLIANNVIDGNGRGITFSGEGGTASSNNVAVDNIISNSGDTWNIESFWGGPTGSGNRAEGNCVWNGARGNIARLTGVTTSGNIEADPRYVDRAAKNFALQPGSPCAGKGPQVAPPPPTAAAPAPATRPVARRVRVLRGGIRWTSGRTLVASVRSRRSGRVTMVARAGRTRLGSCARTVRAGRVATCRFDAGGVAAGRAVVRVTLKPRRGRAVRAGFARKVPRLRVLKGTAAAVPGKRVTVGVRSRVSGRVTLIARSEGRTVGRCRRVVASGGSVGCVFRGRRVERGDRVVVAAAVKPWRGAPNRVRFATTA